MFGLSVATEIFQGSTERTWNCVLHFIRLIWTKLNQTRQPIMPRSRKRHHSHSRSRSRSHDRSREREDKHKKNDSHEKDRDGKRRKIESYDSPQHKRSVSASPECHDQERQTNEVNNPFIEDAIDTGTTKTEGNNERSDILVSENKASTSIESEEKIEDDCHDIKTLSALKDTFVNKEFVCKINVMTENKVKSTKQIIDLSDDGENEESSDESLNILNVSTDQIEPSKEDSALVKKNKLEITPRKVLSPKRLQKKAESEKKRQEKQKEKEEKEKKRMEERERIKQEKLKKKEEKQKEIEQKQKEKEMKEEQRKKEKEEREELRRKEREEKEQKRKEREEKEEQRRKEREQEKLKRQLEIDEKNREKQKEEEKKQKAAAAFVNFFVAKKTDNPQEEKKSDVPTHPSAFMAFEVKSDMKLPPARRKPLSEKERITFDQFLENQDELASYIKDLKSGKEVGRSFKTWPFQEAVDDDITIVEDDGNLGETICEDKPKFKKLRAKFLKFHENRRPAYRGTWRKKSTVVTSRRPFAEDMKIVNYEEDSDDDWEEEEQGESLNGSDDEVDKENEDEKDDYEVDNEFFVPHGHLSDDEVDDEETSKLSPESLKQKLKLLKDEFDQDMQSKTLKLKPRSIGCIWYNKEGTNIEEAIHKYLQPLAMITNGQIQMKKRSEVLISNTGNRKTTSTKELNPEHIPIFLKVIHGNANKKRVVVEQFVTHMANNGFTVDINNNNLVKHLKKFATWRRNKESGSMKNKFGWFVNEDIKKIYNVNLALPNFLESDKETCVT